MANKRRRKTIALFSGGKDSTYAVQTYLKKYPIDLIVSISSAKGDTQLHAGPEATGAIRAAQLNALGLPYKQVVVGSGKDYLHDLFSVLKEVVGEQNATHLVTGDLWHPYTSGVGDMLAGALGVELVRPAREKCQKLEDGERFVREVIKTGIKAIVVSVRKGDLPKSVVGKVIDSQFTQDLREKGIDAAGEGGEYQSLVTDAPIMNQRIVIDDAASELVDGKNRKEQFYRLRVKSFHTEKK